MTTTSESWIVTSGGPAPGIPDLTLPEFLLARRHRADKPAIVDGPSGRGMTYGELADGVRRVAAGFAARGLRKGDIVALLAPNMPEWLLAAYGAMTAGGVVTGVNPLCTATRSPASSPTRTPASWSPCRRSCRPRRPRPRNGAPRSC